MLTRSVALRECLHGGGDLGTGGDCGPSRVLVRMCGGCCGRMRLLPGVRQFLGRQLDDAVWARAVQTAEDVQTLVLASVEVQTEDSGEDEQHHGEVEHNHNGRLQIELQKGKTKWERTWSNMWNYRHSVPARIRLLLFLPFSVIQTAAQKVKGGFTTERRERREIKQKKKKTPRISRKNEWKKLLVMVVKKDKYVTSPSITIGLHHHHRPIHYSPPSWHTNRLWFPLCTCLWVCTSVRVCVCVSDHPQLVTDQSKPPPRGQR